MHTCGLSNEETKFKENQNTHEQKAAHKLEVEGSKLKILELQTKHVYDSRSSKNE